MKWFFVAVIVVNARMAIHWHRKQWDWLASLCIAGALIPVAALTAGAVR